MKNSYGGFFFNKKSFIVDAWQGREYTLVIFTGSTNSQPLLHKVWQEFFFTPLLPLLHRAQLKLTQNKQVKSKNWKYQLYLHICLKCLSALYFHTSIRVFCTLFVFYSMVFLYSICFRMFLFILVFDLSKYSIAFENTVLTFFAS